MRFENGPMTWRNTVSSIIRRKRIISSLNVESSDSIPQKPPYSNGSKQMTAPLSESRENRNVLNIERRWTAEDEEWAIISILLYPSHRSAQIESRSTAKAQKESSLSLEN